MFIYEYSIYLGFPSLMSQTFYICISMHMEEKPKTPPSTEYTANTGTHTLPRMCIKKH